jgi:hypothetical protein
MTEAVVATATPAATTTTTATPAATAATTVATTATTAAPSWHGVPDTDLEGNAYVKNKGWANPQDVINSYKGAEKLIGRDPNTLLVLPRADDPAGQRAVYSKLGMPETADKYDFGKPAAGLTRDPAFETWAKTTFHEAGLTAAQAKATVAAYEKFGMEAQAREAADYQTRVAADKMALQNEWRGGHERMFNAAKTAVSALGFTGEMVSALETALGYAGTIKFMATLGQKLGEDGFVSGDGGNKGFSGTQTPAEAAAEWEKMKLDPTAKSALQDPMHPGHKAAKAKQTNLFKIMYPEG